MNFYLYVTMVSFWSLFCS